MEVVKKNIVSISLGLVALLAVVAIFWPISGLYAELSTTMSEHVNVATQLDSLAKKPRQMPQLSPDSTAQEALDVFPTPDVIQAGSDATDKVHAAAQAMVDRANAANQHPLLLVGELPKPVEQVRYDFAAKYSAEITDLSRWRNKLDATTPPTPTEVDAREKEMEAQINSERLVPDASGNFTADSRAEADLEIASQKPTVRPKMEQERAEQHRIYMLPNTLPVDTTIDINHLPTPDKICDAQLAMWVVDDVTDAIARANDEYSDPAFAGGPPVKNILHAPVKELDKITQPRPIVASAGVDVTAGINGPVPKIPTASPTGRVCNGLYDVVDFKVDLVVDFAKLPQVIKALQVGQFITVLNTQITEVVDPAIAAETNQSGFRYGNKPVVRVEFDCEELFLKSWTNDILPDSRKKGLGAAPSGGAGPGAAVMPSGGDSNN